MKMLKGLKKKGKDLEWSTKKKQIERLFALFHHRFDTGHLLDFAHPPCALPHTNFPEHLH